MKKFTLGVITGVASLAVAVPLIAQVAGAASGRQVRSNALRDRPVPTQACVEALVTADDARLSTLDTMTAAHKTALQAHRTALAAAAKLTTDTERQAAVKKAQEDFHKAMQTEMDKHSSTMKTAMESVRSTCGGGMGMKGGFGQFKGNMGGQMGGIMRGGHSGFGRGFSGNATSK